MDVVVKPKKLVGVIHALEVGGAERMMVTILNYFIKEGFEVHLIIFKKKGILQNDLSPEIIVHDLDMTSVKSGLYKCLKKIHEIKADITFSGIGHVNIALAPFIPFLKILLPKTKWIVRETCVISVHNQASKYPKLFDWLYRRVYKNYDNIITQSEDMKEDLENNYFKSEKTLVINNPVDYERINKLAIKESKFNFDKSKINLLSVAMLRKEKRHDLMLEVLSYLPEKYHLTIVGSGEEEKSLKDLVENLKMERRVTFTGQELNPYTYMKNADLFLTTAEREGFPNVLLEANSLGLPIVAFACLGGIKEIITKGDNGFYVPLYECVLMAKKIEEVSSFNFNKEKIIEDTILKYSQETILNKYKNIFLK
jgi:glycosyltransferase involved in cell wall biosynthesis